jgi:hypothetical protein
MTKNEQKNDVAASMRAAAVKKLQTLDGVGEEIAGALYDAGFRTPTAVRLAPDADLIGIAGIGEQNLHTIRGAAPQTEKRQVGRREIEWNSHIGGPVVNVAEPDAGTSADDAAVVASADEIAAEGGVSEAIVATQEAEVSTAKPETVKPETVKPASEKSSKKK